MRKDNQDLGETENPEDVPRVLRNAADGAYQAEVELQSLWQDKKAGRVWREIGKELEACAVRIEKLVDRYG